MLSRWVVVVGVIGLAALTVLVIRDLIWIWHESVWMGLFWSALALLVAVVTTARFVEDNS